MKVAARRIVGIAIGINMIAFGLDQIRRPHRWIHYIPVQIHNILPLDKPSKMQIHGTGNTLLGLLLIGGHRSKTPWYLAAMWWVFVAPICGRIDWRAGMRDASILSAIAAMIVMFREDQVS